MSSLCRFFLMLFSLILLSACQAGEGASASRVQALPTFMPTATVELDLAAAERVARSFLEAWKKEDFESMYSLITFSSQESINKDDFFKIYQKAHNDMTFASLSYTPRTLVRDANNPILLFNYDVSFETEILGSFDDLDRNLNLIYDDRVGDYRVAWSPGDILPEMANGAQLVFSPRIPSRANIYDRNGVVLADQNGTIVRVMVVPDDIPDRPSCLTFLDSIMVETYQQLDDKLNRSGRNWQVDLGYIEPQVYSLNYEEMERLCKATFKRQATRQYLFGELMPHILGHIGYPDETELDALKRIGFNAETLIGKSGIEKSWDETLRGVPGGRLLLVSPTGVELRLLSEVASKPPESIWLTIDANLQQYVMQVLGEAYANGVWAQTSKGGSAIIMDVNTGEILAMASWPSYEGNAFTPFPAVGRTVAAAELESLANDERVPQLFRPTQGTYPAGSTMKVIDALAVADSGVYALDKQYSCTGIWKHDNDVRFDWLAGGHGKVDIALALTRSCNPFFYEVGFQMNAVDPYLLPKYMKQFGLGSSTGLGDIAEAIGFVPDPDWILTATGYPWNFSEAVTISIGQGFLEVTPLQMARIYAAVANDRGDLVRPQLVKQKGILDQRTQILDPRPNGNLNVKQEVIDLVQEGMCGTTVAQSGTAEYIFRNSPLQNIGVCGKTGTAQAGGPDQPPHSWFIGYAPKDDPQIITLVMLENAGEGSAIAAPLVRQIMEYYFFGPFD